MMVWLAPGLKDGDTYECKSCHLKFVVSRLEKQEASPPMNLLELRTA